MDPSLLPMLLGIAVLLPLFSFALIFVAGPKLKGLGHGAYVATGAILGSAVLSFVSLIFIWLPHHWPADASAHGHDETHAAAEEHASTPVATSLISFRLQKADHGEGEEHHAETGHDDHTHGPGEKHPETHSEKPVAYTGIFWTLGQFGNLRLTISYYIDSLTVCMFCMVTLIASCIHFYAMGYMHDELHDITDHEVTLENGEHLKRPGRYHRFFQYLSLFCFSMLGLVLAGNVAMVFVFWELVGICSYFLIGFYVERKSASTAANKAFIVNRVGDFGMIIGLMAIWAGMGTFAFGDLDRNDNGTIEKSEEGLFSQVRPAENHYALKTPAGLVQMSAHEEVEQLVAEAGPTATKEELQLVVNKHIDQWRTPEEGKAPHGYWLWIIGGLGIFCGCVGKSAQFPLHVWLPDAMEGPTPVSALVHSATMVAAGVYLVGRFYPVFVPEVLLVIAITGTITLFIAATIAITATDIKRVLAYSTVSQLGYMMMALGVGGWVAGLLHLITHAFFKSLLFMCSGSVIHAVHTNEMPQMGGLLKKMPYTAITMLIGCLAIAGVSIPFVVGLSGYYSKDAILEQAYSFMQTNGSAWSSLFFATAAGGAAITAFYMFRLWFLTFMGQPRDQHRYEHAHESPKVMYVPLIILAFFAVTVAWSPSKLLLGDYANLSLVNLLEQSRPAGTLADTPGVLLNAVWPNEHDGHEDPIKIPVTILAFFTGIAGIFVAAVFYWKRYLNPEEVRQQFSGVYRFLINKWWFDELYEVIFVKPVFAVAAFCSWIDKALIDRFIDSLAACVNGFARFWEWLADQTIVDGFVNNMAGWIYSGGVSLRGLQTGRLRQYVLFIVVGTIALFVLLSFFWSPTLAK